MRSEEIREAFLSFYESKGHLRHASSSLVPDDPTLLTTSAGMVQFKPYFLGLKTPPRSRLTTSQKCLRAVDLEEVGRTPRHHTFFEMLGNFSFGDYFKQDAIIWAWTLMTEIYKMPIDRLRVSVYKDDDEAAGIWDKEIGVRGDWIYHLGEKDNYWPASAPSLGPNGPCGPCSEIFFDFGVERGCGKPECDITCDCGRFIEIWNLVFMQYERQEGGVLIPLPKKNIDTGSGLERVASVLQGTKTNFETDLLLPIIKIVESMSGKKYEDNPTPMRVIADHVRGVSFLIADGVFPSNEGRGYLLRKILRRAATSGRDLGLERPFIHSLVPAVADSLGKQYPDMAEKTGLIINIIEKEEKQFAEALVLGRNFVINNKEALGTTGGKADGAILFTAYDTYGLPIEEAEKIVRELGFESVDAEKFSQAMEEQKDRSRKGSKMDGSVFTEDPHLVYRRAIEGQKAGVFDGYKKIKMESIVTAIIFEGAETEVAEKGQKITFITDKSPFYGEMGGQVGDLGTGDFKGGKLIITGTTMADGKIVVHEAEIIKGSLTKGAKIKMKVDAVRRAAIVRHHTATHILHAALREVLGSHVVQSGSYVGPDKLRFDFTHHESISPDKMRQIENLVNDVVSAGLPVTSVEKKLEDAKKGGAMALFGEKYGDHVRVVTIPGFSMELCGGTHATGTGMIGLVKITDERSIGSGMRRIEAVAGKQALEFVNEKLDILKESAILLNVKDTTLPAAIEALRDERDGLDKKLKKEEQGKLKDTGSDLLSAVEDAGGVSILGASVEGLDIDALRNLFDEIKVKLNSYAVLLGSNPGGKSALILAFSDDLVAKGLDAGKMIKDIARTAGGGGGGTNKMAQAGGKDGAKVAEAIKIGIELIKAKL